MQRHQRQLLFMARFQVQLVEQVHLEQKPLIDRQANQLSLFEQYLQFPKLLGISVQSSLLNGTVSIKTSGVVTDASFLFTPDLPIYVGSGGELTQTVPLGGYLRKLGVALSPTSVAINFGPVIRR
jgi:hypothetical protein